MWIVSIDFLKGTLYIAELTLLETLLCYKLACVGLRNIWIGRKKSEFSTKSLILVVKRWRIGLRHRKQDEMIDKPLITKSIFADYYSVISNLNKIKGHDTSL